MEYYLEMLNRKEELEKKIPELERLLRGLPEGSLQYHISGQTWKWYRTLHGEQHYIPLKDKELAQQLALRMYRSRQLASYKAELDAVNAYLSKYDLRPRKTAEQMLSKPSYQSLLTPYIGDEMAAAYAWANAPYARNPMYPEQCNIPTMSGIYVRSKSERLIVDHVFSMGIPFRYEPALQIDNETYYLDLQAYSFSRHDYISWEHLGLMDNPQYAGKAFKKLSRYNSVGLVLTHNLIITTETKEKPLDPQYVAELTRYYFL